MNLVGGGVNKGLRELLGQKGQGNFVLPYHPGTFQVFIAHPTPNTCFFLHLGLPCYRLHLNWMTNELYSLFKLIGKIGQGKKYLS